MWLDNEIIGLYMGCGRSTYTLVICYLPTCANGTRSWRRINGIKTLGFLAFSISYMAYAEGIKGFHQGFAPRVVKRALYLKKNPRLSHVVFAPFFCMSYFYATRKRKISSLGLTGLIVCFVILVRLISQPWRGILDAGVVTGLTIGCGSILYFLYLATIRGETISISADFPWEEKES